MKRITVIAFAMVLAGTGTLNAQKVDTYFSGASEMIFSFASIDNQGNEEGDVMRWAPVLNLQTMYNIDLGQVFGLFTGLAIRNVGYIYNVPESLDTSNVPVKMKYRTYNLGIPVGFKIGKLDKFFLFAGYEIEFPFHYKEKEFKNEVKTKFSTWFSKRVEPVQHSILVGVQFPYGFDLKFKYYFTNFHNKSFVDYTADGVAYKPYDYDANILYFSLSWDLFTSFRKHYTKDAWKKEQEHKVVL